MLNYRVQNIIELDKIQMIMALQMLMKFNNMIMDNEGNEIELCEPVDIVFIAIRSETTK